MTQLLLDTSAVIGLFERQDPRLRTLVSRSAAEVAVSAITLGELEHGMYTNPSEIRRETLAVASGAMTRIDVDGMFAPRCYGFIRSETSRRVGGLDCWIASSAVTAGLDLVTQDAHLDLGLAAIDWSKSPWETPTVIFVPIDDDTDTEA
jgi:predicted nucleic acid-binding protein